ncbi:MAG: reverse transcriptase domain-containing protein, partial [Spirochaetota bacterium]
AKLSAVKEVVGSSRVVQRSVGEIISTIYDPYFIEDSYGFRQGKSCHDAIDTLKKTVKRKWVHYVVEADIQSYFDKVNHEWMMKFLEHRIADRNILRLVRKWLRAGYMENGVRCRTEEGTPQGGPISPLLANIYLHYVLDLWFEKKYRKTCRGQSQLIRYADDFLVCFEFQDDAVRFRKEMELRFAAFNLTLAVDKTKVIEFGRISRRNGTKGIPEDSPKTFEFLGFTHYIRRKGCRFVFASKPSIKSRNKFLKSVHKWLTENKHRSVWYQAYSLRRKLIGYYNYFGLKYCLPSLRKVKWHVERLWFKILYRRSQRHSLTWYKIIHKSWFKILPAPKLA